VDCPSCRGNVRLKVFACSRHGKCLPERQHEGIACCIDCDDHSERQRRLSPLLAGGGLPPRGEIRRNLLYHIYPVSGSGAWQGSVDRLKQSLHLFNGKIIVAVATDPPGGKLPRHRGAYHPPPNEHLPPCDTMDAVMERFEPWTGRIEFVHVKNDPNLREVATFLPLFSRVASTDPRDITLSAHAKGATREGRHPASARWAEILYEVFLDHWPLVERHLRAYPITGAFRLRGACWAAELTSSDWCYAGSWFAFRNRDLFTKPDWPRIDQFWSGIEPYPSLHFSHADAGCLFHDGVFSPPLSLYEHEHILNVVNPALALWKVQNQLWRAPDAP
jgi:hypothetical protein